MQHPKRGDPPFSNIYLPRSKIYQIPSPLMPTWRCELIMVAPITYSDFNLMRNFNESVSNLANLEISYPKWSQIPGVFQSPGHPFLHTRSLHRSLCYVFCSSNCRVAGTARTPGKRPSFVLDRKPRTWWAKSGLGFPNKSFQGLFLSGHPGIEENPTSDWWLTDMLKVKET